MKNRVIGQLASATRKKVAHFVSVATAMVLLSGCAASTITEFDGPTPPEDQIAVLEGYGGLTPVTILSVNGKTAPWSLFSPPPNRAKSATLSPGWHSILLHADGMYVPLLSVANQNLSCGFGAPFEAGHHYKVTGLRARSGGEW